MLLTQLRSYKVFGRAFKATFSHIADLGKSDNDTIPFRNMSQIADITVFDGAATPVTHTLKAISVTREKGKVVAEYRESLASVPAYAQIRMTATLELLKSGVYRCEQRVVVPVMETVSGQNAAGYTAAPKVAYENTVVTTAFFHQRSDITGRRLARQLAINLLGNISTSVAPAATGPIPELIDLLVAPT